MTEGKRIGITEYMTVEIEVIDKNKCFACPDFKANVLEAFGNNEIIYRRFECAHLKLCRRIIEKFQEAKK